MADGRIIVLKPGELAPDWKDVWDLDVTSRAQSPLSPFLIGGCHATDGYSGSPGVWFNNFENLWQYSKVYRRLGHIADNGFPSPEWEKWHHEGAALTQAVRYPAGRDARPEYLYWHRRKLSYVTARKIVYLPKYAERIIENQAAYDLVRELRKEYKAGRDIILRDFDCYPVNGAYRWQEMVDDKHRKFGHGFALAMMIEKGSIEAHRNLLV